MSSLVRSGKSARMSSMDMPPARYSSTSWTVMRIPRMHGWPLRLPGSMVIRDRHCSFIRNLLPRRTWLTDAVSCSTSHYSGSLRQVLTELRRDVFGVNDAHHVRV